MNNRLPTILGIAFGDIVTGTTNYIKQTDKIDEIYVILECDDVLRLDAIQEMAEEGKLLFKDSRSGKVRTKRRKRQPTRLELNLCDISDLPAARPIGS